MVADELKQIDWGTFTGRIVRPIADEAAAAINGTAVLITGAGGSIGSALAREIVRLRPAVLLLMDISEPALRRLQKQVVEAGQGRGVTFVLGDVCDRAMVERLLQQHRIETVFHAAACKYVPLLESDPIQAVAMNTLGTHSVLQAARLAGVKTLVLLSTDKAVEPISMLGASKRMAEMLVLARAEDVMMTRVLRLGNVLGSSGSIGPLLMEQVAGDGPITITHPEVMRYFITEDEAVRHLLNVFLTEESACLWVPEMGAQRRVTELAAFVMRQVSRPDARSRIVYTGLRPGDKLLEVLAFEDECAGAPWRGLIPLVSNGMSSEEIEAGMRRVVCALNGRDVAGLLDAVKAMVPSYRPSATVLAECAAECNA